MSILSWVFLEGWRPEQMSVWSRIQEFWSPRLEDLDALLLQFLTLILAGWVNRSQQEVIE